MPRLEFGIATDPLQALVRLPERSHPFYKSQDGNPFEHLAHTQEKLVELINAWANETLSVNDIAHRSTPLNVEDMTLMSQAMSFKRSLQSAFTVQWGYLPEEGDNSWIWLFPSGDDNHLWWQITEMKPQLSLDSHSLFCIETNTSFRTQDNNFRFDQDSSFELVLATTEEIKILQNSIVH